MTEEKVQIPHWIKTPAGRKTFWAIAKGMGLDNEKVHEIFGVEHMHEFDDTLTAALSYLDDYKATLLAAEADEQVAEQQDAKNAAKEAQAQVLAAAANYIYASDGRNVTMPEAANVAWTHVQRMGGPVWSITVRGVGLPEQYADAIDRDTIRRIANLEKWMRQTGYQAVFDGRDQLGPLMTSKEAWGQQKEAQERSQQRAQQSTAPNPTQTQAAPAAPAPATPSQTPPSAAPPAATPPVQQAVAQQEVQANGAEQLIQAEFIKVTAPSGKPYIEFWRPNRRYFEISYKFGVDQFLSGPGAAMAAAGWTAEHFTVGSEHTYPLNVYWVVSPKDAKYKDIVRVIPR